MDELLKRRIDRALAGLDDAKARQVLDYVEFLQSKYSDRSTRPSTLERLADGVEDTLRVGRVPIDAIKGTRDVLTTADKVVRGIADAGRAVVGGISEGIKQVTETTTAPSASDAGGEQKDDTDSADNPSSDTAPPPEQ